MFARSAVAALVLCVAPCLMAQRSTNAGEITIRGCVSGATRYSFMQVSTGAEYNLADDPARFSSVRGKLIEITGNEYAPKSNGLPTLKVKEFHVVADQCPIHPGTASRTTRPNRNANGSPSSPSTAPYADPGTATQTPPNISNPNIPGDSGAPSPGTGNPPKPPR